jgi:hypothetical protein
MTTAITASSSGPAPPQLLQMNVATDIAGRGMTAELVDL